jgi:hypothetical protein
MNPHWLHLGRIGLRIRMASGRLATIDDIGAPRQELDLWTGRIAGRFTIDGETVSVSTICHPSLDLVAARVTSPLLASGRLAIAIAFPYGSEEWGPPRTGTSLIVTPRASRGTRMAPRSTDGWTIPGISHPRHGRALVR